MQLAGKISENYGPTTFLGIVAVCMAKQFYSQMCTCNIALTMKSENLRVHLVIRFVSTAYLVIWFVNTAYLMNLNNRQ